MIYQLSSGATIELSVEQYLNMSDAELDYLNSTYNGEHIDNPWHGSVLGKQIADDIEEELLQDLTSVTDGEKLLDPDLDIEYLTD